MTSYSGSRGLSTGYKIVTAIFFFGVYTHLTIRVGGGEVSMVTAVPGAMLWVILFRTPFSSKIFLSGILVAFLCLLWSLAAPHQLTYLGPRIIGFAQFCFSITMGFIAFTMLMKLDRDQLNHFLRYAIPIWFFFICLELFTPFKQVVYAYMVIYKSGLDESVLNRDIANAGMARPKLFTSETSYVAITSVFAIGIFAWTSRRIKDLVLAGFYAVLAIVLIRSPICASILLVLASCIPGTVSRSAGMRKNRVLILVMLLILGFLASFVVQSGLQAVFANRIQAATSGVDYSTIYRTYGSLYASLASIKESPIFGVGMGSLDAVRDVAQTTFLELGVPWFSVDTEWRAGFGNVFSYSLVIFGAVGTVLFGVLFLSYFKLLCIKPRLPGYTLLLILGASYGAFYAPKYVVYVYIIAAVNRLIILDEQKRAAVRAGFVAMSMRQGLRPSIARPVAARVLPDSRQGPVPG